MSAPIGTAGLNPFIEHPATHRELNDGDQWKFRFSNGYGASVIRGPYTYGGPEGLWEVAVLANGHITYDTPITDDVVGYLSPRDVADLLHRIASLSAVLS